MTFTTGEPENNSNYSWYTLDSFLLSGTLVLVPGTGTGIAGSLFMYHLFMYESMCLCSYLKIYDVLYVCTDFKGNENVARNYAKMLCVCYRPV